MNPRLALLLAASTCIGVPAAAEKPAHRITWLIGHANLDYFEEAALEFKKSVEEGSGGAIAVDILTRNETERVGEAKADIAEAVARGEAQMGHSFTDVMGALDRRLLAFQAPGLFRDYRHMEGVLEGPVGRGLLEGLRDKGLVGLAFTYSGGACGIASAGRDLRGPDDLKGLKVGTYGDPVSAAWLTSLGALPIPIGHDLMGIRLLARSGTIDAVVSTWRNVESPGLHDVFDAMSLVGSTYLVSVTYANAAFLDSLSPAHRSLVLESARKAARIERAKTIELNETAKRQMAAKGMRSVPFTRDARQNFTKALRPAYDGPLGDLLGRDLISRLRAAPDGEVQPVIPPGLAKNWPVGP